MIEFENAADAEPGTIGRGSGCTIKDFKRALNNLIRKKGLERQAWRRRGAPGYVAPSSPIRKTDPWALL